jgi:hypothetical protein
MSINLKHFLKSGTDSLSSFISVFANPLCVAVVITILFMLIITYSHDNKHYVRTTVRLLFVSSALIFFNNHLLLNDIKNKNEESSQRDLLEAIGGNVVGGDAVLPFQ